MEIEKILKEYKAKKALVEVTQARIEAYKYAILHPELWYKDYLPPSRELGMPGIPKGSAPPPSYIENYVYGKKLNEEIIKQWIQDDESRIFRIKFEVEQIEKALEALTKQERYIVELKYFENMFWKDIEISFNQQFRQKNYVTEARLKQIKSEAINKLQEIFDNLFIKIA